MKRKISGTGLFKKAVSSMSAAALAAAMFCGLAAAEEGVILNTDFESDTGGFNVRGTATVVTSSDTSRSGEKCLLVGARGGDAWNGASRGLSGIKLDETYTGSVYVKAAVPGESFEVKLSLETNDYDGVDYPYLGSATVNSDSWTLIEGTWKADYNGNLDVINLNIETGDNGVGKSFYVDDAFFALSSIKRPSVEETVTQKKYTYSNIEIAEDVEGTEYEQSIELMQALGVMDGYPDGTFKPESNVTRAEFVTMLLRLKGNQSTQVPTVEFTDVPESHFANGYIGYAASTGLCEGYGDGIFGPDDNVTYEQAVKMLMVMMGYGIPAQQRGGYPNGYMSVAGENSIYVNGVQGTEPLNRGKVTQLFASALDKPMYVLDSDGKSMYKDDDSTIISVFFDGVYEKGSVLANNSSSISGITAALDCVNIDGSQYKIGNTRADELVGYNVKYIAVGISDADDGELKYIAVDGVKTDELELSSKDIEDYSGNKYEYIENGKTRTVKIDSEFSLVYNGKTVESGFDESLMTPQLGSVKLVANSAGDYNTVIIKSYDTYIVESVNKNTKTVFDKDRKQIELDYESGDSDITFMSRSGNESTFEAITEDCILHIAQSLDGDKTEVIINTQYVDGEVTSVSSDYIVIGGKEYDISDYYNENYELPSASSYVTAYLDLNGDIVYMDADTASGMSAAYMVKCFLDDGDEDYTLRLFTADGKMEDYTLRSNITIDGAKYDDSEAVYAAIDGLLNGAAANYDKAQRRIILYSANSRDEITKIDTAYNTGDGEKTIRPALTLTADEKYSYKQSTGTFYNSSSSHYFSLADSAVVFSIPKEESNTSGYEIKSKSSFGWADYELYPFKAGDDSMLVSYGVEYADEAANIGTDGYVITKIVEGLNSDNEEVKVITLFNGTEHTYALKEASLWKNEWDKGTIVRVAVNANNEIAAIEEAKTSGTIISDYDYSGKGYIYEREGNWGYFTTTKPSANMDVSNMVLLPLDKFAISVYNKRTEQCYSGTVSDITDYVSDPNNYTEIFITMNYENPKTMICIVDY